MGRKKPQQVKEEIDLGTVATRERLRQDPVKEMAAIWRKQNYREADALEASAQEIRRIYKYIVSPVSVTAQDYSAIKVPSTYDLAEWLTARKRDCYNPWAKECGVDFSTVIAWLIDEQPLASIDRFKRQRKGKASEVIVKCLIKYAEYSGRLERHRSIV